jgi:DUF4097 and DUF4098 domain-containing protein YvlB
MEHVFETPRDVRLRVRNQAGPVEVDTVDGTTTTVTVTVLKGSPDLAEQTTVQARETGDGHEITVETPRSWLRLRDVSIAVRVQSPHGTYLDASTASGEIVSRGQLGSLSVKTASGDVDVERVAGDASASTASGDVSLEAVAGELSVNSASGDVNIGRVDGDVNVRLASGDLRIADARSSVRSATVSGDQEIDAVERGSIRTDSVSGDVTIGVRRGASIWMDVQTLSGSMSSELEIGDNPDDPGRDPDVELRGKTVSGDVLVRRAPGRETTTATAE